MATASEIQSLEDINYKSRIKFYFYPIILIFVFVTAFLNFYPIGDQIKILMKKNLQGSACNPDFDNIRLEWVMPKIVISDLTLPASCLGREGDAIKFSYLNINFNFINFSPLGIPFKIETSMNGQPLTLYFVQGFGERLVRIKDQTIVLSRLESLMGGKVKIAGNVTIDVNALLANNNTLKSMSFKASSHTLQFPPQTIEGFNTPAVKVNDLFIEANADSPTKLTVSKFILGDPESPMRANFKGKADLQQGNTSFSPIDLIGEVSFSENFKQTVPLVDLFFARFTQKDGFYQVRLGGTLGQPSLMNP